MTVLFLHGLESTPGGSKPSHFSRHGHHVLNPALPADDFQSSLVIAQAAFDEGCPDLVVGSSRGGAVALNLQTGSVPLLLICPAWKKWGDARSCKAGSAIMHSQQDQIILFASSKELQSASPPNVRLVTAGSDHRMGDPETLDTMLRLALELVSSWS